MQSYVKHLKKTQNSILKHYNIGEAALIIQVTSIFAQNFCQKKFIAVFLFMSK